MIYLEAPHPPPEENKADFYRNAIFLAGTITEAWNWQEKACELLLPHFNVINPRRKNYDIYEPNHQEIQITWEWNQLQEARHILFWFSHETVAPITLLELGTLFDVANAGTRNVVLGIDTRYPKRTDLLLQTKLRAPELYRFQYNNLDDTVQHFIKRKINYDN